MSSWQEIYKKEIVLTGGEKVYFKKKVKAYLPLIKHIVKNTQPEGKILEAGCGTAVLSTYLSNAGFRVIAVDKDEQMIELADKIASVFPKKPKFLKVDLFNLNFSDHYFGVSFSHGTLEHFNDQEIIALLNIQLRVAKTVIVSIPSEYFKERDKMYGNERFLSKQKWVDIIERTNGKITEEFGYFFQNRVKTLLPRLFKRSTPPYIAFVINSKNIQT